MVEETIASFAKLPKRSLIYILVCAGGILCFIGIGILPNQNTLSTLDEETSIVEFELQTQKTFFPVFKKAMQNLHAKKNGAFDLPEKTHINFMEINTFSPYFKKLAFESGLHFKSGIPEADKINRTLGIIPFTIELTGSYFDFRKFLTKLALVSYLDHIESIEITAESGIKEYRLRMNLSAENGAVKK